jgi:hypothetical protein
MGSYQFAVYQVDSNYYGYEDGFILATDSLTITDSDSLLHATNAVDPANDQVFDFASESAVTSYNIQFLDFAQVNLAGPSYELFAMNVDFADGSTKYYVMSKDPGFVPSPGDRLTVTSYSSFANTTYTDIGAITCFLAGTHVETPSGSRAIEEISVGDQVLTLDHGPRPVRFVAERVLNAQALSHAPALKPIKVRTPGGALFVSPQHRMVVSLPKTGEVMVPAKLLAEEVPRLARVARGKRKAHYIHLLLDRHEVLLTEGVASESMYLGTRSIAALNRRVQDELNTLFPNLLLDLLLAGVTQSGGRARPFLTRREVRQAAAAMTLVQHSHCAAKIVHAR